MRSPPAAPRSVRCPTCSGDSIYAPSNPYRPFCSDRCKNVDLGAWASEGYSVPAPPGTADDGTGPDGVAE